MKTVFLTAILAMAMAACLDPASDPSPATSKPALDDPGKASPNGANLAGFTWQEQTVEMCFDWFLAPCTSSFPAPQCQAAPAGQPCSSYEAVCYQTINRREFRYYICM